MGRLAFGRCQGFLAGLLGPGEPGEAPGELAHQLGWGGE